MFKWVLIKVLIISSLIKPVYDVFHNLFGIQISFIHKSITVVFFIFLIFYFLFIGLRIRKYSVNLIFISFFSFYFFLAIYVGFYNKNFNLTFLSHIYFYLMPLFSFYFGFKFDNCDFFHLIKFLNHIKNSVILILVLCTLVFFISYYIFNSWIYVSYTTNLIFALALFGSKFRFDKNIFFIFLDFISLKRSSLVLWLINYSFNRKFLIWLFLVTVVFFGIFNDIFKEIDLENFSLRYTVFFNNFDILDEEVLFIASGGRSTEWFEIFNLFNNDFKSLFLGFGFGARYSLVDVDGLIEFRHYSHFTFLTFAFISGFIFSSFLFLLICYILFKYRKFKSQFKFYFFIYFILSFAGASLLVEPLPWLSFGIFFSQLTTYKS